MRRYLLAAALLIAAGGGAVAQGVGIGVGTFDLLRIKAGPPAPVILLTGGTNLLTGGTNLLKE